MEKKSLERELHTSLREIEKANWSEFSKALARILPKHDRITIKSFLIDSKSQNLVFGNYNEWNRRRVVEGLVRSVADDADDILSKTTSDEVRLFILNSGLYKDISVIDALAIDGSEGVREFCSSHCSLSVLRQMKGSKSKSIRRNYYSRLGAVECLDEMLDDKLAEFRQEGIGIAPFGYHKLNAMTKEIARGPFMALVRKISPEYLPMLLANRNIKNSWVARAMQDRLDGGV
jgi:hypothetical protein